MKSNRTHPLCGLLAAAVLLGGCAEPAFRTDPASAAAHTVPADRLAAVQEPGLREVAVVINGNAYKGVHAGMFAGNRLYDPSGTYAGKRSEDKGWRQPTLADYLAYQLADGPDVRLYRFDLAEQDFVAVQARIGRAGWTLPSDCAVSVRDVLAGIGPFHGLKVDGWISPKRLATLLDPLSAETQPAAVLANTPAGKPAAGQAMPAPWWPTIVIMPGYHPNYKNQPN